MSDNVIVVQRIGNVFVCVDSCLESTTTRLSIPLADLREYIRDGKTALDSDSDRVFFCGVTMTRLLLECLIAKLEVVLGGMLMRASIEALSATFLPLDGKPGHMGLMFAEHMSLREAVRLMTGHTYGLAAPMQG